MPSRPPSNPPHGRGRRLTSASLLEDFGPGTPLARRLLRELWDAAERASAPGRAPAEEELYSGWVTLFAQASSPGRAGRLGLRAQLEARGLPPDAEPTRALFVLHTYCAILFELLAAEVVGSRSGAAPCAELVALEDGALYAALARPAGALAGGGVRAFREAALFDWYLAAPSTELAAALRELARRVSAYDLARREGEAQDVARELYQGLVPRALRHRAGEFYTPRWLAEHLLDAAGYEGEGVLDGVVLDPTCGSGTFLVLAISRYRAAAERAGWSRAATLRGVLAHVRGLDLNPLAVLAARLNVLLAVRDLAGGEGAHAPSVDLADALAPGPEAEAPAPGARGRVSWVVGNPPWVRWSELPAAYRERVKSTCERYGIFSRTPFFGGNELDISAIVLYAAADEWLAPGGTLALVMPQTHLQAPSSAGFRAFTLPDGTPLGVSRVHDWTGVRAFGGVANKPATIVLKRGAATAAPVPYRLWSRREGARLEPGLSWSEAAGRLEHEERLATPLEHDRRWALVSHRDQSVLARIRGEDPHHRGRKGVTCDLNAAYFVTLPSQQPRDGVVTVRTDSSRARHALPARTLDIEAELVHPLLKGAGDFSAFRVRPSELRVIVPNRTISGIDAQGFAARCPRAYAHFASLETVLERRSTYRTRMRASGAPFYAIYNVGPYTFAPHKVVWAEIATRLQAAVIGAEELPGIGPRVVVPDHKIYFVACEGRDDAHYLCAMLNSRPVRSAVDSFTVKLQVGTLFKHIRLPRYDPTLAAHRRLAALSLSAHDGGTVSDDELELLARAALGLG